MEENMKMQYGNPPSILTNMVKIIQSIYKKAPQYEIKIESSI